MRFRIFPSRFGDVLVAARDEKLRWLSFTSGRTAITPGPDWVEDERDPLLGEVQRQLKSYFIRRRERFELPLDPHGTTFQKRVWDALLAISYGKTLAYSELARQLGKPAAFRAVGAANGQNPISVIIPCHRLIGKNGSLTDYGGGSIRSRGFSSSKALLRSNAVYDGKTFVSVESSPSGDVSAETRFCYHQDGDLVWATYEGGAVRFGTLVAKAASDGELDMRYQHLSVDGELKTGRCRSVPERLADGRLRLYESWQWTSGDRVSGVSILEETS